MKNKVYLLLTAIFMLLSACSTSAQFCEAGKGQIKSQTRNLPAFNAVELKAVSDVYIYHSDTQKVIVSDYQNLLPLLETTVQNGKLVISYKKCTRNSRSVVKIYVPKIEEINILGAGDTYIKGNFSQNKELALEVSGAGDIKLEGYFGPKVYAKILGAGDLTCKFTDSLNLAVINVSGAGDVTVSGPKVNTIKITSLGAGDIDAQQIKATTAYIKVSGSGDTKINVTDTLYATLLGSGDLYYSGNPKVLKVKSTGSGDIIH